MAQMVEMSLSARESGFLILKKPSHQDLESFCEGYERGKCKRAVKLHFASVCILL